MHALAGEDRDITNIVFMGMGEPLLNLEAVLDAIRILMHPKGFGFAGRRITVSTVGIVPGIEAIAFAPWIVGYLIIVIPFSLIMKPVLKIY